RLSPREREILAHVAAGASNKQIAAACGVSPNTVKFHLAHLFAKLGADSRAEAVATAIARGELAI
ncbi:MAG TPA: helix-turn-helix transcriptional regulator, partial [Steroidobacteraceae bacterium]